MSPTLQRLVEDIATCIKRIDARRPQAANARTGEPYQPGIGPHPETQAVALIAAELPLLDPAYQDRIQLGAPHQDGSHQKCDLCIGTPPGWDWAIEVKMLRLMGENGKANDNMLMHILSPYAIHRSALTNCEKLLGSRLAGCKAIVIYGFDYSELPMDPAIEAFVFLARARVSLGPCAAATYSGLVHPVHREGRDFRWELSTALS